MAETLGTLSDKLTIVKLKQWHTEDSGRLESLSRQEKQLQEEIDEFISEAVSGKIPDEKLTFAANKVYKKEGNETKAIKGTLGEIFSSLAEINCRLWHVQETVYDFEAIPVADKDSVIKDLAVVNLERNNAIDELDRTFQSIVRSIHA
jgi:hypothetical protein